MQRGFSNIADISAKLFRFWAGDDAGAGDSLQSQGEGKAPKFQNPGGAGAAVFGRINHDATQEVIINTISVPAPLGLDGSVEQGETSGVTTDLVNSTITYDGGSARLCEISATVRLETSGTASLQMNIEINGSIVFSQARTNVPTGQGAIFDLKFVTTLNPGDVVRLSAENLTNTNNVFSVGDYQNIISDPTSGQIQFPPAGFFAVEGL